MDIPASGQEFLVPVWPESHSLTLGKSCSVILSQVLGEVGMNQVVSRMLSGSKFCQGSWKRNTFRIDAHFCLTSAIVTPKKSQNRLGYSFTEYKYSKVFPFCYRTFVRMERDNICEGVLCTLSTSQMWSITWSSSHNLTERPMIENIYRKTKACKPSLYRLQCMQPLCVIKSFYALNSP